MFERTIPQSNITEIAEKSNEFEQSLLAKLNA